MKSEKHIIQLREKAQEITRIIEAFQEVEACTLYGSLAEGREDIFSDVDIEIKISERNAAEFVLSLPCVMQKNISVVYFDYAPSLAPEKYVLSLGLSEDDPFLIADLCIVAETNYIGVTKEQLTTKNRFDVHLLKLWIANYKHHARGQECTQDIRRMAGKCKIENADRKNPELLLEETLKWLEQNAGKDLKQLIGSCRKIAAEMERSE